MRRLAQLFYLFASLLAFAFGCQKDEYLVEPGIVSVDFGALRPARVSLYGRLTDTEGSPVADAVVRAGDSQTRTDVEGLWRLDGAEVRATFGYVTFESPRFLPGSRTVYAREGSTYEVDVQLLSREQRYTVSAATGGQVEIAGSGARVEFPAAAFAKTGGGAVTGDVSVVAHFLDASDPATYERMPGDLRGRALEAPLLTAPRLLTSYGMVAVELTDASGAAVELAPGKTATLTFPIPEAARSTAPNQLPLWYFKDEIGLWIEEGFAERRGDTYVGEVSHFTFWNCDVPTDFVELCGRIGFEDLAKGADRTTPLTVGIESAEWGSRRTYVDSTGAFCGLVPRGETLVLRVYGDCGTVVFERTIGPFTAKTTLDPITIKPSQARLVRVTGSVTCGGVPAGEAAVRITPATGQAIYVATDATGNFSGSYIACDDAGYSVTAINYATLEQSAVFVVATSEDAEGIALDACSALLSNFVTLGMADTVAYTGEVVQLIIDGTFYGFRSDKGIATDGESLTLTTRGNGGLPLATGSYVLDSAATLVHELGLIGSLHFDLGGQVMTLTYTAGTADAPARLRGRIGPVEVPFAYGTAPSPGSGISRPLVLEFSAQLP